VAFPESFIPNYPDWVWAVPGGDESLLNELYAELLDQAVTVPSPATDRLCQAARSAGCYVVMGVSERNAEASNASMYNTLVTIDDQGNLLGKHRKLVPTGGERLVWAQGDGSTLGVYPPVRCAERADLLGKLHAAGALRLVRLGDTIYIAATWIAANPGYRPSATSPRKAGYTCSAVASPCAPPIFQTIMNLKRNTIVPTGNG